MRFAWDCFPLNVMDFYRTLHISTKNRNVRSIETHFHTKSGTFSPERVGAVWPLTEDGSAAHGSFARQVGRMPTGKRAEAVRCGARDGIAWQTGKAPNGTWRADGRSGTPLSAGAFAHGCISASWKCSHARASPESRAGRPRPRADGSRRNVLGCGDAGP